MPIRARDVILNSLSVYLRHWKAYLPYVGILLVASILPKIFALLGISLEVHNRITQAIEDPIMMVILVISWVAIFWSGLAIMETTASVLKGGIVIHWKDMMLDTARKIIPAFVLAVIATILITIGSILVVVPGIILTVWFWFSLPALIIDNQTIIGSLKASKDLAMNRWWRVAWLIIAPTIVFAILSFIVLLPVLMVSNLVFYAFDSYNLLGVSFATGIVTALFSPLFMVVLVDLYTRLKQQPVATITK